MKKGRKDEKPAECSQCSLTECSGRTMVRYGRCPAWAVQKSLLNAETLMKEEAK